MEDFDEVIREFVQEASEGLGRLDSELVALEADPGNSGIIQSVFRTVHTIKGTSGFLGFTKLVSITHVGENLLDGLRAGRLTITQDITSALLEMLDAVRSILTNVEHTLQEGSEDYSSLVITLTALNEGVPRGERQPEVGVNQPAATTPADPTSEPLPFEQMVAMDEIDDVEKAFWEAQRAYEAEQVVAPVVASQAAIPEAVAQVTQQVVATAPGESQAGDKSSGGIAETALRVDVSLLDQLMNLVGELVLARNQILQFTKTTGEAALVSASQRLNLITSELQEGVMKTRMQPIANVWNKFPRVVRDVARTCGKQVRLEMEGKETDLDKTIIEAIKDPLTHIVRNAVDHGIENPADRVARGKDAEGRILLRALHEGGHVIIEISDDGGGLNTEKIRKKALERNLVSPEKLAKMGEQELHRLIFLPGFSTAEAVTSISGRGVGMDVVRSNIERIGGVVDITSVLGKGSSLKIKIPLTLAIVPALVVSSHGERFAVPQVNLLELVRVEGDAIRRQVEEIAGAKFYRLRGDLLPLVSLNETLNLSRTGDVPQEAHGVMNIVVVTADKRQFGLVVDQVHDTEEIVVKPLSKQLKHISVFAGTTIMGDGHVALILDVLGLAKNAKVVGEASDSDAAATTTQKVEAQEDRSAMLIVQAGKGVRGAIPLEAVNRLEKFPVTSFECASGRQVVQYRGGILPLVDLTRLFTGDASGGDEMKEVVVFNHGETLVGFLVDRVVDIVEEVITPVHAFRGNGIKGSAIIQKQVTDLFDLPGIIESQMM